MARDCEYGAISVPALERSRRPASSTQAMFVAVVVASVGVTLAVALIATAHRAATPTVLIPMAPPMMDHLSFGVGNEDRIEEKANWALRVLGGMNGTLIEAMMANGTIASPEEVIDPELVAEIHQAQHESDQEYNPTAGPPEPFPFEAPAEAEGEEGAGEEGEEAGEEDAPAE